MLKKIAVLCLLFVLNCVVAFAETEEWVDKSYDFHKIRAITVVEVYPNNTVGDISKRIIPELTQKKMELNHIRILTLKDIDRYMAIDGYDFTKHTQEEINQERFKTMALYSEATLFIAIAGYGMGSDYVEGSTINYQTQSTSYITGTRGNVVGYMTTPTTSQINIPGGDVPVAYAYIEAKLFDNKTQELVYGKHDFRDRANITRLDNTTPKDLYLRIIGALSEKLNDLIGKKY